MSPNGSQELTLGRARVPTAKFLSLQRLSSAETRQGSVGGARYEISQTGTGAFATGVALAAAPPRGSRQSRKGDRGIRGNLAACPQTLLAPCIFARGQLYLGIHFAARVNIPLDPPIPRLGRARGRGMVIGYRRTDPSGAQRFPGHGEGWREPARRSQLRIGPRLGYLTSTKMAPAAINPTPIQLDTPSTLLSCEGAFHQFLDKAPKVRWHRVTCDHLVIANTCPPESLLLYSIACRCRRLMMASALVLDCVSRLAVLVHEKQVNTFGVYAAVGVCILAAQNLAQRHLRHHLPSRIAADYQAIEFLEYARFAFVQ